MLIIDVSTFAVAVICTVFGFVTGYYATKKKLEQEGLKQ